MKEIIVDGTELSESLEELAFFFFLSFFFFFFFATQHVGF